MAVTKVLILVPLVWLWRIVFNVVRSVCRDNLRTLIQIQRYVALQMNRHTQIIAGREINRAAASRGGRVDGFIYRLSVESVAVTGCPVSPDVVSRRFGRSR